MIESGSHIPVYRAYIVAILVLADFAESHTATLEGAMIFAAEELTRKTLGPDLDFANALYYVCLSNQLINEIESGLKTIFLLSALY